MWSFALIAVCLAVGFSLRRSGRLTAGAAPALNAFVIYLALPAVVMLEAHRMPIPDWASREILFPAGMAWIVFAGALALGVWLGRRMRWPPKTTGAFALTAGLGNTSFVGFPLVEALYGKPGLQFALIADQLGSFVVVSTLGILTASISAGADASRSWRAAARRIAFFPPFLALVAGALSRGTAWPDGAIAALERLGSALTPVALVSVGSQLRLDRVALRRERWRLAAGLGYKLSLAPAFVYAAYALAQVGLGGERGLSFQVSVIEAAMAPMVTAAIVSADYGLDSELANLMVGIGVPLSLVTVPAWAWLLG